MTWLVGFLIVLGAVLLYLAVCAVRIVRFSNQMIRDREDELAERRYGK